jgi:hypothetical protein
MKQVRQPMTVSPSNETSEEIIRIAGCSDEEIIKILEKKQNYNNVLVFLKQWSK